jgi:hypothetical protein
MSAPMIPPTTEPAEGPDPAIYPGPVATGVTVVCTVCAGGGAEGEVGMLFAQPCLRSFVMDQPRAG